MAADHVEFPRDGEVDLQHPPAVVHQADQTCLEDLDPLPIVAAEFPSETAGHDASELL